MTTLSPSGDQGGKTLSERLDVVEPSPYLESLEERFAIPRAFFDDYLLFRSSTKRLSIVRRDVVLPERPAPQTVGMPFYKTKSKYPRLTTSAALKFGHLARRNTVELSRDETIELVLEGEIRLPPEKASALEGTGYVLPRYSGHALTIAFFRLEAAGDGLLVGAVPKAWRHALATAER